MAAASRILVVEDNDFVRMQIVRFLKDEGYDVAESADGEDALGKMDDSVALAVVDVRMEPIDGFEFLRRIRGLDLNTAIVLVTGDHNPDLLAEAGKWGVVAVLLKPVQRERLVKTVARTLQQQARVS